MYEYVIDPADHIEHVNLNWDQFAIENDAQHLCSKDVLGTSIWQHITGEESRELYRMLFERVRKMQRPVEVAFRCDSPTLIRWMTLTLTPQRDGRLKHVGRLVRAEPRPYQALLDPNVNRSTEFLTICSWCKKVRTQHEKWTEVENALQQLELFLRAELPQFTHGVCEGCYALLMQEMDVTDGAC